jgi:hypothetical protein
VEKRNASYKTMHQHIHDQKTKEQQEPEYEPLFKKLNKLYPTKNYQKED